MSLIAVYPGTFDPITNGHTDLVDRGVKIFDKVIVAVAENPTKNTLFNISERINFVNTIFQNNKSVVIYPLNKLLVEFAKEHNATVILRGLRAVSDFEYEFQLAGMNKKLNSNIETMFLMSDIENQIISSKFVKEIAKLNGNINRFVTKSTVKMLKNKF